MRTFQWSYSARWSHNLCSGPLQLVDPAFWSLEPRKWDVFKTTTVQYVLHCSAGHCPLWWYSIGSSAEGIARFEASWLQPDFVLVSLNLWWRFLWQDSKNIDSAGWGLRLDTHFDLHDVHWELSACVVAYFWPSGTRTAQWQETALPKLFYSKLPDGIEKLLLGWISDLGKIGKVA